MGIVYELAREVLNARYEDLPADVVHQVKRVVLDSLGCMLGGRESEAVEALAECLGQLGGPVEASVVAGPRASALSALLLNGAMLRFLDFNDVQYSLISSGPRHGHNSELLPAVLALAERQGLSGRDVVVATSLGYDVATRFTDAIVGSSLEDRGWNMDTRASFVVPLIAGRLLGLSALQMENAVGLALSRGLVLNVLDSAVEENTMAKNLRFPLTAHLAVMAAYLAKSGVTGPPRALEGSDGFISTVLREEFDMTRLLAREPAHRIREVGFKQHAACYATHGHLTATLGLVQDHDLQPHEVQRVRIRTTTRGARHTGHPDRRLPRNKETADHSSHYLTAIAILDRAVGPAQFAPAKYTLPTVQRLVERVTIEGDPRLDAVYPSAVVEIETTGGTKYERTIQYPRGHPTNPMTDAELATKYASMAEPVLGIAVAREVEELVWGLERLDTIGTLMQRLGASGIPVSST
jgi:2-methylcitrate dehydratase